MYQIILLIILYCFYSYNDTTKSEVDYRNYIVLNKHKDKDEAANILAEINNKSIKLINYMFKKYTDKNSKGYILASRLKNRYRPETLRENDPKDKNSTSYTENKGAVVALCLREKESGNNNFHEKNILEFVQLHELAHICSVGYGHDNEFWDNFKLILSNAVEAGIHIPKDYKKEPINYCGLDVEYNPYFLKF